MPDKGRGRGRKCNSVIKARWTFFFNTYWVSNPLKPKYRQNVCQGSHFGCLDISGLIYPSTGEREWGEQDEQTDRHASA